MFAGILRTRTIVQKPTATPSGIIWTDAATAWAAVSPAGNDSYTVKLRRRNDVTIEAGMRLSMRGKMYGIEKAEIFSQEQDMLILLVTERS